MALDTGTAPASAPVEAPAFYFDLLASDAASLDMWETEYLQVLQGDNPVKEWTKGTWLSPLLNALDEPEREQVRGGLRKTDA